MSQINDAVTNIKRTVFTINGSVIHILTNTNNVNEKIKWYSNNFRYVTTKVDYVNTKLAVVGEVSDVAGTNSLFGKVATVISEVFGINDKLDSVEKKLRTIITNTAGLGAITEFISRFN